jgi:uncharacterized protein YjiS (DUF1127 family)
MPNEYALIGPVNAAAHPGERVKHAEGAAPFQRDVRTTARRPRARVLRVVARRAVRRVTRLLRLWRRRIAESNELMAMSDRELRDFGASRYDAEHEAKKAFWKASRGQW